MSRELVIVAAKQDSQGNYIRPQRASETPDEIAFYPENGEPNVVKLSGYGPGDTIPNGKYYVTFYDPTTKSFLGQFMSVSGYTIPGIPKPKNIKVVSTTSGATVTAEG
ncbi:hypothetical protein YK48G_04000 [Lentilactobacillus fungorum]|uniref:Uncharacterized protein n=1 Tax=Lentilactobacillus fungorum TaxID=2201250 RepID=A0ABQ3VWR7_9LACO|nr:hypothetical protein [Lentilactobacillus fungorum]GHP12975.1 hypothetical protein YK48G_04000 [Lentilactobacillus fungorum]